MSRLEMVVLMSMGLKKVEDNELQDLLDKNPAQILKELSNTLAVDESTLSRTLHALGNVPTDRKQLPRELIENAFSKEFNIVISLLAR